MSRPLRICHLGKFYPPATGGIEAHVQTLARVQAAAGAEVRVVCINHADEQGSDAVFRLAAKTSTQQERDRGVLVIRLGRVLSVARLDVAPELAAILRGILRDPPDVLHVHTPNPAMLALVSAPPAHRLPCLVITHHSDVIRQKVLGKLLAPLEREAYGRAAAVVATSPRYLEGSALLRRVASKVRPIPLGIELEGYLSPPDPVTEAAAALRRRHQQPLWLLVGRLVYYKGIAIALDALARVPGHLLIVGHGPLEPELRRQVEALGLVDRVTWCGQLSDEMLRAAYLAATALWFPSIARSEAFGLVQVEALASGCPVINTAIAGSGVPWVAPDGQGALTVPVGDADAFAGAASKLLDVPGLRQRLADAGRARAKQEFSEQVMGSRMFTLYDEVTGSRSHTVVRA